MKHFRGERNCGVSISNIFGVGATVECPDQTFSGSAQLERVQSKHFRGRSIRRMARRNNLGVRRTTKSTKAKISCAQVLIQRQTSTLHTSL